MKKLWLIIFSMIFINISCYGEKHKEIQKKSGHTVSGKKKFKTANSMQKEKAKKVLKELKNNSKSLKNQNNECDCDKTTYSIEKVD